MVISYSSLLIKYITNPLNSLYDLPITKIKATERGQNSFINTRRLFIFFSEKEGKRS